MKYLITRNVLKNFVFRSLSWYTLRVDIRCGRFSEPDFNTDNWSNIFAIGLQIVIKYFFRFSLKTQNAKNKKEKKRPIAISFYCYFIAIFHLQIIHYKHTHEEKSTCTLSQINLENLSSKLRF